MDSLYAPLTLSWFFQFYYNWKEVNKQSISVLLRDVYSELSMKLSVMVGTFCICAVRNNSHYPHVAPEHLKDG